MTSLFLLLPFLLPFWTFLCSLWLFLVRWLVPDLLQERLMVLPILQVIASTVYTLQFRRSVVEATVLVGWTVEQAMRKTKLKNNALFSEPWLLVSLLSAEAVFVWRSSSAVNVAWRSHPSSHLQVTTAILVDLLDGLSAVIEASVTAVVVMKLLMPMMRMMTIMVLVENVDWAIWKQRRLLGLFVLIYMACQQSCKKTLDINNNFPQKNSLDLLEDEIEVAATTRQSETQSNSIVELRWSSQNQK